MKLTIANTAWLWLLLSWAASTPGWSADWPMFRGQPALTGIAPGQLPEKPALLWSFKTAGPVKSSAAIVGNRVFVGSDDRNLYALDLTTGKKVWAFTNSDAIESSPLVLDGKVFVGSSDANLYALDAATGKQIWKYTTGDKILGAPNWFVSGGQTNVLIGSYDFKLHCLTAATGKSNWVYESANYINGSPAVAEGQTVFGGCDGLLYVIALADGSQSRSNEIGAPIAASVALADGRAYFGHYENQFLCADLKLGSNVWAFHDRQFPYFSSPAVTKDRVVFGGRDKMLHCVNRADGKSVWSFATRGRVDSSPVVCGDKVVVGSDDGRVYLISLNDGKELWSYEIGQPVGSSPAVADGKIVIGSDDGSVYCFGTRTSRLSEKLGKEITLEGTASNLKVGACLVGENFTVWINSLDRWPENIISGVESQKLVRVTGKLIEQYDLPVFIPKTNELPVSGIPVPEGTDLRVASHRFLLRDAKWELLKSRN